jgi:hypothetical protein
MPSFADIGMPFPLFAADIQFAQHEEPGSCSICGKRSQIRFSDACYSCFRDWKSDHSIDTELGMVRLDDARAGKTHGLPLRDPGELRGYSVLPHDVDPRFPDETWFSVLVPSELLMELVRTPAYSTWQGECWLFCCSRPSVFVGEFPLRDSTVSKIADVFSINEKEAGELRRNGGGISTYFFRCATCGRERGHYDHT